jgi:hypothetical protein
VLRCSTLHSRQLNLWNGERFPFRSLVSLTEINTAIHSPTGATIHALNVYLPALVTATFDRKDDRNDWMNGQEMFMDIPLRSLTMNGDFEEGAYDCLSNFQQLSELFIYRLSVNADAAPLPLVVFRSLARLSLLTDLHIDSTLRILPFYFPSIVSLTKLTLTPNIMPSPDLVRLEQEVRRVCPSPHLCVFADAPRSPLSDLEF